MGNFLKEILIDYVSFIVGYKELIIQQNGIESDFIDLGSGTIGDYSFFYHGAGCRLEKEGVVCEFDFLPENGFPIKFSNWEVYEFINTNAKWSGITYNLDEIHIELLKLVEKRELVLLDISGVKFLVFQIKDVENFLN
ncbi:DUF6896 domain-containing protein [Pedobacter gandavensis]|uniref:DUF6896 domain-containing protein n=1 Tax=Pedobacter gandavensis TaxID=2679963 RepID=UPI00292FEBDB|nr:hypothetical protein [Pedobacter gandavensis]